MVCQTTDGVWQMAACQTDQQRKMVNSRKQSIVEAAEAHFDKNTLILIVNVVILTVLISLLYMIFFVTGILRRSP
ncbi:hypothetical protein L3Y34_004286 [Caenorhabditis briggsae]|nr:hypothetical protein L3Y34_004286 [Caenorhabditis briggsae]